MGRTALQNLVGCEELLDALGLTGPPQRRARAILLIVLFQHRARTIFFIVWQGRHLLEIAGSAHGVVLVSSSDHLHLSQHGERAGLSGAEDASPTLHPGWAHGGTHLLLHTQALGVRGFPETLHTHGCQLHHALCQWHQIQNVPESLRSPGDRAGMKDANTGPGGENPDAQDPQLPPRFLPGLSLSVQLKCWVGGTLYLSLKGAIQGGHNHRLPFVGPGLAELHDVWELGIKEIPGPQACTGLGLVRIS